MQNRTRNKIYSHITLERGSLGTNSISHHPHAGSLCAHTMHCNFFSGRLYASTVNVVVVWLNVKIHSHILHVHINIYICLICTICMCELKSVPQLFVIKMFRVSRSYMTPPTFHPLMTWWRCIFPHTHTHPHIAIPSVAIWPQNMIGGYVFGMQACAVWCKTKNDKLTHMCMMSMQTHANVHGVKIMPKFNCKRELAINGLMYIWWWKLPQGP